MENQIKVIKLFDAIELDEHLTARQILKSNISSSERIPSKQLCGLAILAAENGAIKVANEFLKYNAIVGDKDLSKYLKVAFKIFRTNQARHDLQYSEVVH